MSALPDFSCENAITNKKIATPYQSFTQICTKFRTISTNLSNFHRYLLKFSLFCIECRPDAGLVLLLNRWPCDAANISCHVIRSTCHCAFFHFHQLFWLEATLLNSGRYHPTSFQLAKIYCNSQVLKERAKRSFWSIGLLKFLLLRLLRLLLVFIRKADVFWMQGFTQMVGWAKSWLTSIDTHLITASYTGLTTSPTPHPYTNLEYNEQHG